MKNLDKKLFSEWMKVVASAAVTFILLLLACAMCGCRSAKNPVVIEVPIESSANERVVHIQTIDTVLITIPAQSAERVTPDSTSHLETGFAESDAWINPDGTLGHSLRNKEKPVPVQVKNEKDSVLEKERIEVPVEVPVPFPVEKELTKWEKTKMCMGGLAIIAIVLVLGFAVISWFARKFRK